MTFDLRMLYSNFWLFTELLTSKMEPNQMMNSLIRTTTALTIINGGIKVMKIIFNFQCRDFYNV
jgi:hypothetical protein